MDDQCSACGERNPAGSAFCVFCGTYLGWNEPGTGPADPAPPSQSPQPPPSGPAAGVGPQPPPPVPGPPAPAPPAPAAPSEGACPSCGQPNAHTRRFCSRCGFALAVAATPRTATSSPGPSGGWWDPESREARRAYRRSLPGSYWLRRALVALAAIAAVALVLALTGRNPVQWTQDTWHEWTTDLTPVEGVTARADPKGSVPPEYDVRTLPDPRTQGWATAWPPGEVVPATCGDSPAAGRIILTWDEPTRVRGLNVWAGLPGGDEARDGQLAPRNLGVTWQGTGCVDRELARTPDRQTLEFDTVVPVNELTITVDAVYPPDSPPAENLVALGGIEVLHQP